MPAKLKTPIEIIKKDSIFLTDYSVANVFINLEGEPYVRVTYKMLDQTGKSLGEAEAMLRGQDFEDFIIVNPASYNVIKRMAYSVGQTTGAIPDDVEVT